MSAKTPLHKLQLWAALSLFALSAYSCSEPASPFGQTAITVEALDASCTEVWLELKFSNLTQPADVAIQKDGKDYHRILSLNRDTLLVFEDLVPSTNYSYRAIIRHEGKDDKISNTVQVRTMDTTSHNFTWQTFTFGEVGSSSLYDVAIIDENNIWAVGEIYMKDSLGNPDPNAYNAVHWDGTNWELKKIYTGSSCNPVDYSPLKAIFAFSDSNIAITSGGSIGWFNGKINRADCGIRPLLSGAINKMWGTSSSDLYVVGNGGNIAHYNGTSWQKIESGITNDITDIWGISDGNDGFTKYFAAENYLIKLDNFNNLTSHSIEESGYIRSIWAKQDFRIYAAGDGMTIFNGYFWNRADNPELRFVYRIKGEDNNSIAGLSANRQVYYFNGISWVGVASEARNSFLKLDIRNHLIASVGRQGDKAMITIFK
ncbi:MAG: glucosyl transferase [Ignavibacteriales bacterium]|nr:hypothetical protein [Ignavibacteriaceae bacterium]QOJ28405.1 MAG: glucosyl transferase [Ignavibacteriales bacterium]